MQYKLLVSAAAIAVGGAAQALAADGRGLDTGQQFAILNGVESAPLTTAQHDAIRGANANFHISVVGTPGGGGAAATGASDTPPPNNHPAFGNHILVVGQGVGVPGTP